MKDYLYDVFLSFTGADRDLKNAVRLHLEGQGLRCYDSDLYCKGQFRADFCEALDKSRVYLMLLTDNLRNDPTVSGHGTFTEVRREGDLACQLEAAGELNIVILCMSEFFRYDHTFHDYHDAIGWHFYSLTRGFSEIYGQVGEDAPLSAATLDAVYAQCKSFVDKRREGRPIPSQMPRLEIAEERLPDRGLFCGRETEIETVLSAFREGKRAVVLSGLGGIGKTTLATEIARRCEELGYLRCPQIVHIGDMAEGGSGLAPLVGAVSYEKEVYDSLPALSERDRYERKLRALSALPETILLVVDNYNTLREETLAEVLSRLKCRLLFTTRARISSVSEVAVVPIEPLDGDEAHRMFERTAGRPISHEEFLTLYRFTGGHTITLCIMAGILSAHGMAPSALLSHLEGLDSFDARIDFRHNEHGDSDTVLGHLKKLFDISGLDDGCRRILRSLSILGDRRIPLADLERVLALSTRNEVLTLVKNGWLAMEKRETAEAAYETVYLHPIISRLSAELLSPSEETVGEMIAYLIESVSSARASMTYVDAARLADSLFYACYVLAGNSHRLPQALFDLYGDVNHLLGNAEETARRMAQLSARLTDTRAAAAVVAYGDMLMLEQFPMRVEIIEKYMQALEENAEDYKWLLRALSVTFSHISSLPQFRPFFLRALRVALRAAMAQQDDLAIRDLFLYAVVAGKDGEQFVRMLEGYLRRRGRARRHAPLLIALDFSLCSFRMYDKRVENFSKAGEMLSSAANGDIGAVGWRLLKHPLNALRAVVLVRRIRRLEDTGATARILKASLSMAEELMTEGRMNVLPVIEAMVELHNERLAHHLTLASAAEEVRGAISFFQSLPPALVRQEVSRMVEGVDEENVSVASLSSLQVAALINEAFRDREALVQSRKLVAVVKRLRPGGHNDIYDAALSHAALCDSFGEQKEAFEYRYEVYRQLTVAAPESQKLSQVAARLLRSYYLSRCPLEEIREVRDVALRVEEDSAEYYEVLTAYFYRTVECYRRKASDEHRALLDEAQAALATAADKLSRLGSVAQQTVMYALQEGARSLAREARAEELLSMLIPYKKSKHRRIRALALLLIADGERMLASERCYPLPLLLAACDRVVDMAVKKGTGWSMAATAAACRAVRILEENPVHEFPDVMVEDLTAYERASGSFYRYAEHLLYTQEQMYGEQTQEELDTVLKAEMLHLFSDRSARAFTPGGKREKPKKSRGEYYADYLAHVLFVEDIPELVAEEGEGGEA